MLSELECVSCPYCSFFFFISQQRGLLYNLLSSRLLCSSLVSECFACSQLVSVSLSGSWSVQSCDNMCGSCHLSAQWCSLELHHSLVSHAWLWSCVLLHLWVRLPHFYLFAVSGCSLLTISACYWPCSCFIPRLTLCVDWSPEADLCLSDYYRHPPLSRPNEHTARDTIIITDLWRAMQKPSKTLLTSDVVMH